MNNVEVLHDYGSYRAVNLELCRLRTQMKIARPMKCCSKRNGIINEGIRTELGIFSLNKKTEGNRNECIS